MFLVTGATGFVGRAMVERLLSSGAAVRLLDLRAPAWLPLSRFKEGQLELVLGDVTDPALVRRAMAGVDVVFHLAAQLLLSGDAAEMRRVNVDGCRVVLHEAARAHVRRVVYTSTGMLYPASPGRALLESDMPAPSGPYGLSKLAAEGVFREYERKVPTTILRPLLVIGRGRLGVLALLFQRLEQNRPLYLVGSGENRFHMVGVEDVAEACYLAAQRDVSGVFNIGVARPTPVRPLLEALRDHVGSRSVVVHLPRGVVVPAVRALSRWHLAPIEEEQARVAWEERVLDVSQAEKVLGWTAKGTDEALLRDAWEGFLHARNNAKDHSADWPDGGILSLPGLRRWL